MKTKLIMMTLLLWVLLLWNSCSKNSDDPITPPEIPKYELSISPKKIVSTQVQTTEQIDIKTNIDLDKLEILKVDSWVTCLLNEKTKKLDVHIEKNEDTEYRQTLFVIQGEGLGDTLKIEQLGATPNIIFTEDNIPLDYTTQNFTVELRANVDNLVVTPLDSCITQMPTKSMENQIFHFQITENDQQQNRVVTIQFSNETGTVKRTVSITQTENPMGEDLTMAYNLNVVYFVPNDIEAHSEYERRISELMLWAHNFYAENMERNGFGKRGFGLRTLSKDRVNIITIHGEKGYKSYPYEGGGGVIINEMNAYFSKYPDKKESDHTLVITPTYPDFPIGGGPFYGLGRNCFAIDYPEMDIKYLGKDTEWGRPFITWFGGLCHELGHGLNLPHNRQWISQNSDPNFGTTLMGAGNSTLGYHPTFLSKASCAILNNCQVFSNHKKEFYQSTSTVDIEEFHIEHKTETIHVRAKYKNANKPINAINIYVDDYPFTGVNENYDAEAWCVTDLSNNEFSIEIPLNEINQTDTRFRMRTWFLFEDGTLVQEMNDFDRTALKDYHFTVEKELSKTNWEVAVSSLDPNTPATNLIDNNAGTVWNTKWLGGKDDHPHVITIDMKETKTIRGISLLQRDVHAIHACQLEISTDGTEWEDLGNYNLLMRDRKQYIYLPEEKRVQKFRISTISNHAPDDPYVVTVAEIGAFE